MKMKVTSNKMMKCIIGYGSAGDQIEENNKEKYFRYSKLDPICGTIKGKDALAGFTLFKSIHASSFVPDIGTLGHNLIQIGGKDL